MNIHEQSLRDMLPSVEGGTLGNAILAQVVCGNPVTVTLIQGGMLTLTDLAHALRVLQTRFGWAPVLPPPKSKSIAVSHLRPRSDEAAASLFEMCSRMGRHFTMQGIVARVATEQPNMVLQFAELWARLINRQLVKVHQSGEVNTYEITKRDRGY